MKGIKTRKRMTTQKATRSICEAVIILKEQKPSGKNKEVLGIIDNINSYSIILDTSAYSEEFHYKLIPMNEIHGMMFNVVEEDAVDTSGM